MKNGKPFNVYNVFIRLALCFLIITIYCETSHGQDPPQLTKLASLYINFDDKGVGYIALSVMPEPSADPQLERALAESLGVSLNEIQIFTKETIKARMAKDPEFAAEHEYTDEEMSEYGMDFGYSLTATFTAGGSSPTHDLQINLGPLLQAIRPTGIEWLDLTIMHPLIGRRHCEGIEWTASTAQYKIAYHSLRASVNDPAQAVLAINYRFGSAGDYTRLIIPIALIFLVPIALTLWMRRRALRLCGSDPTAAWFRFFRSQNYIIHSTWLAWLAALPALDLWGSISPLPRLSMSCAAFCLIPFTREYAAKSGRSET